MRDLEILRYTDSRMHVSMVSTAGSVDLIRNAKKEGLQVTCGIAAHQLSFFDEDLSSFDTRLKVLPPFRRKADKKALIKGLLDGTIDVICSDHTPEDIEHKKSEFEHASFGISSLETAFSSILTAVEGKVGLDVLINCLSHNPRKLLGLPEIVIEEGAQANLTLFDPSDEWLVKKEDLLSKSDNTPFGKMTLKGLVHGVIRGKSSRWN
ncbi:MAG: amidohydrolase family protein [Flavobacteriales bacterium]|nr:amidohydrolase family protein [Flavobacteriales bacterium]